MLLLLLRLPNSIANPLLAHRPESPADRGWVPSLLCLRFRLRLFPTWRSSTEGEEKKGQNHPLPLLPSPKHLSPFRTASSMPSIVVSDSAQSPKKSKSKSKEKKMKAKVQLEADGGFESPTSNKKHKKVKKSGIKGSESKQPKLLEHQGDAKKRRRGRPWRCARTTRKTSETSSELVDPENLKGKKKKKKARLSDGGGSRGEPQRFIKFQDLGSRRFFPFRP